MPQYDTRAALLLARRYAESNMTAQVRIIRMDKIRPDYVQRGQWDADELFDVYQGKARVYNVAGPVTMGIGDAPSYYSTTYVSIPSMEIDPLSNPSQYAGLSPRVDDIVEVLKHDDPYMIDRKFRVLDVEAGGQFPVVRRMQVIGIQASKQWGSPNIPQEWIVTS